MTDLPCGASQDAGRHELGKQMCSVVDPLTWLIQQRVHLTPHNTQFFGYTTLKNATPKGQSQHLCICNMNPQPLDSKLASSPTGNDSSSSTMFRTCPTKIKLHMSCDALLPKPRLQTEHQQRAYQVTEPPDQMSPLREPPWPLMYTISTTCPPKCGDIDLPGKASLPAPQPGTTITHPNLTSCTLEPQCRASTTHYPTVPRMLPTPPSHDQAGHVLDPPCPSPYCLSALGLPQQSAAKASLPSSKLLGEPPPPPRLLHHDTPRSDTSMHHSPANHTDMHSPAHPKLQRSKIPHKASSEHPPGWPYTDSSPHGNSSTSSTSPTSQSAQSAQHKQTTISDTNTSTNTALLKSATPHEPHATIKLPQPHTNTWAASPQLHTQNDTPHLQIQKEDIPKSSYLQEAATPLRPPAASHDNCWTPDASTADMSADYCPIYHNREAGNNPHIELPTPKAQAKAQATATDSHSKPSSKPQTSKTQKLCKRV